MRALSVHTKRHAKKSKARRTRLNRSTINRR